MSGSLVADRYVRAPGGWLDVATGEMRRTAPDRTRIDVELSGMERIVAPVVSAAARERGCGFRVVRMRDAEWGHDDATAGELARTLIPLGYVVVDAGLELPQAVTRQLAQRHVALVLRRGANRDVASGWVRRLADASVRAHILVVSAGWGSVVGAAPLAVRERAPEYGPALDTGPRGAASSRSWGRARTAARNGRPASEARWLRAALEECFRRGDEVAAAGVARRLAESLARMGRWDDAWRTCRRACLRLATWPARCVVADLTTAYGVEVVRMDDVDAMLAGVAAEAVVRAERQPAWIALRQVQSCFWQGRHEEAAMCLQRAAPTMEARVWQLLVEDQVERVGPDMRCESLPASLAFAIRVEALARTRGAEAARSCLAQAPRRTRWSPLQRRLASHLRGAVTNSQEREGGANAVALNPTDPPLPGLDRWGRGGSVTVLRKLPELLQDLSDAEDDAAALQGACRWIRSHSGIAGAAVLGPHGERIATTGLAAGDFASDDLRLAGLEDGRSLVAHNGRVLAASVVRYAGRRVGLLVVAGGTEVAETAQAVAAAAAPLCGPALRSRLDAAALDDARLASMPELLGGSPALDAARRGIARAARTAFAVLIEGESGTGKELAARALHRMSPRRDRSFCAVNCAALTDELVEAELFGHARGAFTGAMAPRAGLFEEAHGGTLFLDEVGELSPRAQAKLLRALQEREIRRVGENTARRVDVRVIAATNRPLSRAVAEGSFREDLLFRLAVVRIRMPPLRERLEDIALLAQAFWTTASAETGTRARLGPDALAGLCRHTWPGNVRELQNVMSALVVLAPPRGRVGARLVADVFAHTTGPGPSAAPGVPLDVARRACERVRIGEALARHGGRRAPAARELGLTRQGLTKAMRRLGLGRAPRRGTAGVA